MIGRSQHLSDDRLYELYLAERSHEPLDPRLVEHLAECRSCHARHADLALFMEGIGTEAAAEADEIFTPAQLHQQQEHILRRIEHLTHPARVLSFPGRVARGIAGNSARVAPRWLAAAAAAGLFVGVVVGGRVLTPGRSQTTMNVVSDPATAPAPRVLIAEPAPAADTFDDDAFLRELEFALDRPHTRELQPFDALTPHVQEIDNRIR